MQCPWTGIHSDAYTFFLQKNPWLSVNKTSGFSRSRDSCCPLRGVPELVSSSSHEGLGTSSSLQSLFSLPVSLPRDLLPKRTLESLGVVTLTSRATSTDSLSPPVLASIATQTHASFSKEVSPYRLVNSLHPCREEAWAQALIKKGFNSHASDLIVSRESVLSDTMKWAGRYSWNIFVFKKFWKTIFMRVQLQTS